MKQILAYVVLSTLLLVSCDDTAQETTGPAPALAQDYKDLVYATTSPAQKLDLYLPTTGSPPYPVLIWIHGGGWISGDKAEFRNSNRLSELRKRGYAVASINYRLSGEAIFPAQIQDVKASIRWIKANSAKYQLNATKLGVWGSSAGGHLAALAATSGQVSTLEDLSQGNPTQSSSVQVAIVWYGPIDLVTMDSMALVQGCFSSNHNSPTSPESMLVGFPIQTNRAGVAVTNPLSYLDSTDPPMFIEHGLTDCTVSYLQSQHLYDRALPVLGAGKLRLKFLAATGHGGNLFNELSIVQECIDYLDVYLK
jgi:acetyl esterase/lipase